MIYIDNFRADISKFLSTVNGQLALISAVFILSLFNSALGLAGVIATAFHLRATWQTKAATFLEKRGWLIAVVLPAISIVVLAMQAGMIARDDLLRDVIVGTHYGYDYSRLYPVSSLPSFNLWYGFDHALTWLQNVLSPLATVRFVQTTILTTLILILAVVIKVRLPNGPDRAYWVGLAVLLGVTMAFGRVMLGRPEIILAVWALASLLPVKNIGRLAWLFVGMLLSTGYWLAFLYFPIAFVLGSSLKHRVLAFMALMTAHCAFWLGMFGHAYLEALLWLPKVLDNQVALVAENIDFSAAFGSPSFVFVLAAVAVGAISKYKAAPWLLLVCIYFLLSNQIRYIGIVGPLLVVLAYTYWGNHLPQLTNAWRAIVGMACLMGMASLVAQVPEKDKLPQFHIPDSARVIATFGEASYAASFFNPGIQVEPSYAFGAAPQDIQRQIVSMTNGEQPDCDVLHRYQFTHVVEKSLIGEVPSCLKLVETDKEWRLWHVR